MDPTSSFGGRLGEPLAVKHSRKIGIHFGTLLAPDA
jgi:hypothetical protein